MANGTKAQKTPRGLLEYRVMRLEEAVLKLASLSETVGRWDERFAANGGLMQCQLHTVRMADIETKLGEIVKVTTERTKAYLLVMEHEEKLKELSLEVKEFKAYMYKGIGFVVACSVLIQIAIPFLLHLLNKTHL